MTTEQILDKLAKVRGAVEYAASMRCEAEGLEDIEVGCCAPCRAREAITHIDEIAAENKRLRDALERLASQAIDCVGVIEEYIAMPCDSLRAKFPTTAIRLKVKAQQALQGDI